MIFDHPYNPAEYALKGCQVRASRVGLISAISALCFSRRVVARTLRALVEGLAALLVIEGPMAGEGRGCAAPGPWCGQSCAA